MTDATTGPGAEGAPRDGERQGPKGRPTPPAMPPVHDLGSKPGSNSPSPSPEPPPYPATTSREPEPATGTPRTRAEAGARAGLGNGTGTGTGTVVGTGTGTGTGALGGKAGPAGTTAAPARTPAPEAHGGRLLPPDECDKLSLRLQHAVAGFVDGPRDAVEEADQVLEEAAARFTEAVALRRRTLRGAWGSTDTEDGEGGGAGSATRGDTEQLRLALRDYRELADRLLRL